MPPPRIQNVGQPAGPDQWFKSLPIITQYWFGATAVLTIATNFDVLSPMQMIYSWHAITSKFELWRVLTAFCYAGPFSFPTLITVYMLVSMSKQYEAGGPFNTGAGGGTADYATAMLFAVVVIIATYPIAGMIAPVPPLFCRTLVYYVLYLWSRRNPTGQANIWGIPVPAVYLPFAYLALSIFMGNPFSDLVHGMAVGHLYFFLVEVVPRVHGKEILTTPQFLIDQLGVGEYRAAAPARNPDELRGRVGAAAPNNNNNNNRAGGGYNWGGGGRPLGRD